jgi:hypothetical protein
MGLSQYSQALIEILRRVTKGQFLIAKTKVKKRQDEDELEEAQIILEKT